MKIRNGFVSNSSSSSFVIALSKKPKKASDILAELFGNETEYPNPYVWDNRPTSFPAIEICERLLKGLRFSVKEITQRLIEDYEGEVSWGVRELGEVRAKGQSSSLHMEGDSFVSSDVIAQRQINEYVAKLKKFFPRTKWAEKIEASVVRRMKWQIAHDEASKKRCAVESQLRKDKNLPHWKWQDTSKMSRESKIKYDKAYKEYEDRHEKEILQDPRYVEASKALSKLWHEDRHDEVISLIAKRLSDIFFKENKGKKFAITEISDDSEIGSAMEHGTLFNKVPHLKFSHH